MPLVTTTILLPDPAHRLWPLVRWDGRLCEWYPGAVAMTVEGHGKGARRRLHLADGATLLQRLDHVSRTATAYSYSVLHSPYPVADLLAQIRVQPAANGHALLIWTATFRATAEHAEEAIRRLYDDGTEQLRRLLIGVPP